MNLAAIMSNVFYIIGAMIILCVLSWKLCLIMLACILPMVGIGAICGGKLKNIAMET